MREHEIFQMTCACGKNHVVSEDRVQFPCSCGRQSVVDWACTLKREETDKLAPQIGADVAEVTA